jgi:hypothetical protein
VQGRVRRTIGELGKLVVPLAVLASVWPATLVVEAATAGANRAPVGLLIPALRHRGGLTALEASQQTLASEAEFAVDDVPVPDLASRAIQLAGVVRAWNHAHPVGDARARAIASAMVSLDRAIAALASDPSPGERVAFEQAVAAYHASLGSGDSTVV